MADNSTTTGKIYELRNSANQRWMNASASQTRGSSSQNYSTIDWSITVGGSATYWCDTGPTSLWVGSERVYYLDRVLWSYGAFPVRPGTQTGSTRVYHNTDGSVSNLTISLTSAINTGAANADTVTATLTMSSIARYFSSTPSITSVETTETSVKYNWSTSETCSQIVVKYKKANASSYTTYSTTAVSATSGSFTITGLSPGTKYNVYITAKRSDSGLTSDSGVKSPTTYSWPYVKSVSASQLIIGDTQTLTIYNPRGHALTVYMKQNNTSGTTLYSKASITNVVGENATYSFTPTASTLYSSIPSVQVGNTVYYCSSSGGGATGTVSGTYKITGSEVPTMPSSMFTFSEGNSTVSSIKPGGFVQSLSIVQGLVNSFPTGNNSASITSCTATLGGVTYNVTGKNQVITWSNLNISGSQVVDIVATDSRGLSNNTTLRVEYLPYSYPSISATAVRVNNYGTSVTLSATYTVATVNSSNQAKLSYNGASKSGYMLGSASAFGTISSTGKATLTASLTGIDNNSSYTFSFSLTDRYGQSATASANLSRGLPIMFVDSAVLGVGVNKFPSFSGLDVNGPIKTNNTVTGTKPYFTDTYRQITGGNTNNYPWRRIATVTAGTGSWTDKDCIIEIRHKYNGGHYGKAKIGLRTNSATNSDAAHSSAVWLERQGMAEDSLAIAHWGVSGQNVYADVYYRVSGSYPRASVRLVDETMLYTLISSNEVDNTTTSDKKTSSESYVNITTAATEVRGQAYTAINYATDSATFNLTTIYPVGSIYMSTQNVSPASFIGGSWSPINNVFLLAQGSSYAAGGTGGASTVTLTTAQLPKHTHGIPALSGTAAVAGEHSHVVTDRTTSYGSGSQSSWRCLSWSGTKHDYWDTVSSWGAGNHSHSVTTNASTSNETGSGSSHNNMPPYLVVYMWKRTA